MNTFCYKRLGFRSLLREQVSADFHSSQITSASHRVKAVLKRLVENFKKAYPKA